MGKSLSNQEIFRRIAAALGLTEPALFEADPNIIANVLKRMKFEGDFADLQELGHFHVNGDEPLILHADLKFDTPSGHIEIASATAVEEGLPRLPHAGVDEPPGTVLSYKGRWPSLEPDGKNINFLHAGSKNDMTDGSSVHGMLVTLEATK